MRTDGWDSDISREFAQLLADLYNVTLEPGRPEVTPEDRRELFLDPQAHKVFTKVGTFAVVPQETLNLEHSNPRPLGTSFTLATRKHQCMKIMQDAQH